MRTRLVFAWTVTNNFRPATKFLFQLKQKITFIKLDPTIDITIVPLCKQRQFHFLHQSIVTFWNLLTRYKYLINLRVNEIRICINIPQPVQYQLYTLVFPFDLGGECVTCVYIRIHIRMYVNCMKFLT